MSFFAVVARLAFGTRSSTDRPLLRAAPAKAGTKSASVPSERDPDRHELKYWVPEERVEEVIRFISEYVEPDPHGANGQINTSLYFDTPDLRFFRTHMESSPDRRKLRIRAYGDPPVGLAFFETKRKVKAVTVKTRASVPMEQMSALLDGSYDELPQMKPSARRHLDDFLFTRTVLQAEPLVLVRANRRAFASPDPADDIRVTFDSSICFQRARGPSFECDANGWIPIDGQQQHGRPGGAHVLLELKFPRIAPSWMRPLTEEMGVPRIAYSKYMSAVRILLDEQTMDRSLLDRCAPASPDED